MTTYCGLDFGTSNSTIGVRTQSAIQLVPLDKDKPIIRSAIFCDAENKEWVFGQEGVKRYLESTSGRLMMALKSVLGSSLMEDKTLIFNEMISYTAILGHFLKYLKARAENFSGHELTQAVMGRPVRFHDTDATQDKLAQQTLEKMAREAGFKDILFQYEPIAAALSYETSIRKEQLALIIDMGGGTSDFTVIRLHPGTPSVDRTQDVLANCGIHIAGTDFDKKLSLHSVMPLLGMGSLIRGASNDIEFPSSYYHDLTTWHTLAPLYNPKTITHVKSLLAVSYEKPLISRLIRVLEMRAGHHILHNVEVSKQRLSDTENLQMSLDFIEEELTVSVTRQELNTTISPLLQKIVDKITETIRLSNTKPSDIKAIFYTGGSTKMPIIHELINPLFPNAEIIHGDAFGSVGTGLTIDASRRFQ